MIWKWADFWCWWMQIETPQGQLNALTEVPANWIKSLPAEGQIDVLQYAPWEVKQKYSQYLNPIAQKKLGLGAMSEKELSISDLLGTGTRHVRY